MENRKNNEKDPGRAPRHDLDHFYVLPPEARPPSLANQLKNYKGNLMEIAINYFQYCNDYKYFMRKVIDEALGDNPLLLEDFTLNVTLITSMKDYGYEMQNTMFEKIELMFEDKLQVMQEASPDNLRDRHILENFCDFIGQLYFRFRENLETQLRYSELEIPVIECMKYLLRTMGFIELLILYRMVTYNYSALCVAYKREMAEFLEEVASVYSTHRYSASKNYRVLLEQILDSMNNGGFVHEERFRTFYQFIFGESLDDQPTLYRRILGEIPEDLERNHWHKFNCSLDIYKHNMFARDVPC